MAVLGMKDAAKEVGMTRQGIWRAIQKGQLSASKNATGQWEIDTAELFRVYQPVTTKLSTPTATTDELQQRIDTLEERLRLSETRNDELREDLQHWRDMAGTLADQLKALPAGKQAGPKVSKRSFWSRLFR